VTVTNELFNDSEYTTRIKFFQKNIFFKPKLIESKILEKNISHITQLHAISRVLIADISTTIDNTEILKTIFDELPLPLTDGVETTKS